MEDLVPPDRFMILDFMEDLVPPDRFPIDQVRGSG